MSWNLRYGVYDISKCVLKIYPCLYAKCESLLPPLGEIIFDHGNTS